MKTLLKKLVCKCIGHDWKLKMFYAVSPAYTSAHLLICNRCGKRK